MIDQTQLLRMIMENNKGKSPAFILEQFSEYLKGLNLIHGDSLDSQNSTCAENKECKKEEKTQEQTTKNSLTCGYTKRNLKVKPETAIQKDQITCCLCGKAGKVLTERHLKSKHNGLTRQGYLKLCGYPEDQVLMSENHFASMKVNVSKAQQAKKDKKASEVKKD